MVNIFRRHSPSCSDFGKRTDYRKDRCACLFWAQGAEIKSKWLTKSISLKTRDTSLALRRQLRLEETGGTTFEDEAPVVIAERKTLKAAIASFFEDPDFKKKNGTEVTRKFRTNLAQLEQFAARKRKIVLDELDADFVADFRNWYESERPDPRKGREGRFIKDGERAANNKFRQMRQFFKLGVHRGWIAKNPTEGVTLARIAPDPKAGLRDETMERILEQAATDIREASKVELANAQRAEALILLMRYSGLRISDAVGCPIDAIRNGRVVLTARKNSKGVDNALPEYVVDKLFAVPAESEAYFFWTGRAAKGTDDDPKHRVKDWQGRLKQLFDRALGKGKHHVTPHVFRHTFAQAILKQPGKTMQDVADALGDSVAIVEKHYAGRNTARTARTHEAIRSTWENDPTLARLQMEKYGSHKVVGIASKRRAG